jgi:hypothetical protein
VITIFAVVGQHEEDPDRWLLLGEDGQYYEYDVATEVTTPVQPKGGWVVDQDPPSLDEVAG